MVSFRVYPCAPARFNPMLPLRAHFGLPTFGYPPLIERLGDRGEHPPCFAELKDGFLFAFHFISSASTNLRQTFGSTSVRRDT